MYSNPIYDGHTDDGQTLFHKGPVMVVTEMMHFMDTVAVRRFIQRCIRNIGVWHNTQGIIWRIKYSVY